MFSGTTKPNITINNEGTCNIDSRTKVLEWHCDSIDKSNASGTMEFSVASDDITAFFPIRVDFTCARSLCGLEVQLIILLT